MDRPEYSWSGGNQGRADLHFHQLLSILYRRRRWILATAAIGMTLVLLGSLLIPPQYTAKAQIVVDTPGIYHGDGRSVIEEADIEAVIQTYITALTSEAVLKRVLDSLTHDPDFRAARFQAPSGAQRSGSAVWLEFGARLRAGLAQLVASRELPTKSAALRLDDFVRRLNVYQEAGSHVIALAFKWTNPGQAALAANRLAELFIQNEEERKRAQASDELRWLGRRIPEVKEELERDEAGVQNYRIAHGLAGPNRTDLSDQQLADLTRQLSAAELDLATRQAKLAAVRELQRRGGSIELLVEKLNASAYRELLRREVELQQSQAEVATLNGQQYPKALRLANELAEVRHKLSDEVGQEINGLNSEVQISGAQVLSLRERLAELKAANGQAQEAEPQLRELERAAAATAQVYERLLQRREELGTQQEAASSDLRILSPASPPDRPSSANPLLFALPSLIVFLIGGGLLAVAADRLDRGLRSSRDVHEALGIPVIGLVPRIPRRRAARRPHQFLMEHPFAAYTEAIRSVVAELQFATPEGVPKLILISSSVPREGKTTLAVSFAVSTALIGRRALLVDFDCRPSAVPHEPSGWVETGTLDSLSLDDQSAVRAIQLVPGLNLDYLAVRGRSGDPLLPFVSGYVLRFLRRLRDSYDCVVIDGPSLLTAAEARLLAAMADKVLLVVKSGDTRRDLARDALNLLRELGIPGEDCRERVCVVLMQAEFKQHAQYRHRSRKSLNAIHGLIPHTATQSNKTTVVDARDTPSLQDGDTFGNRPQAAAEALSISRPHGWRPSLGLWTSIFLLCLVVGALLVLRGHNISPFAHRDDQRVAGFIAPDVDNWDRHIRDAIFPAAAGTALHAKTIVPPPVAEQKTPLRADKTSVAPNPGDQIGKEGMPPAQRIAAEIPRKAAAHVLSNKEGAAPPTQNALQDNTIVPAPRPALLQSSSTIAVDAPTPNEAKAETTPKPGAAVSGQRPAAAVSGQPPSDAEIDGLVTRGDALMSMRELASARLFYQRAAEAGDGGAALRLGVTFDPAFLDSAKMPAAFGNEREAFFWYRRARDLNRAEGERHLPKSEAK